jgi:putative membrane-bound dehydrogenase-like protein
MIRLNKLVAVIIITFMLMLSSCSDGLTNNSTEQLKVPEGYSVEVVAGPDLVDYPMFATLDAQGRLFVFESTGNVYDETQDALDNPQFRVKLLEDLDGDGKYDKSTIFADKIGFPQGGVFYKGSLIITSAPDLIKLTDTDGDGVSDIREVLLSGWNLNINANSLIGPAMGPDGWLYMTSAIRGFDVTSQEGERMKGETARIWRVRPDGSDLEWVSAGGMNNPVELTFTNAAEVLGTMTYFTLPKRGLRDALCFWVEGGIYGRKNRNIARDKLTLTGDLMPVVTKYSRVSPSGVGIYRNDILGEDFKNNLFSAQFNTNKVIRHKLFRDGANFRTEDEVFLSTENPDFHPTDVLEDADGSLLLVETGGWFIKGCPLSQVSKPELKGSIYRIRNKEANKVDDPYGNDIQWKALEGDELGSFLERPNPFISDRALETVVDKGSDGIEVLSKILNQSASEDARTKAVFGLYRIGNKDALAYLRSGLKDKSLQVRVATARAVGLAKDPLAAEALIKIIGNDEPAAIRQAATALGQIGDDKAVEALLAATANTDDRFVQHALRYSLIILNRSEKVMAGLKHESPRVRESALIVLDQMEGSPLNATQLTPFLDAPNESLKQTALWVASHHPEWSAGMIGYLQKKLNNSDLSGDEQELLGQVLIGYCGDVEMQDFMARQLNSGNDASKLFILTNMANCQVKEFPQVWVDQLGKELMASNKENIKTKAIELIRLRSIKSLDKPLSQIADSPEAPASLRVEAIGGLLETRLTLTANNFSYLLGALNEGGDAPFLQQIASVFAKADLSETQLAKIATEYLPKTDNFMLPRLLPVFEGSANITVGKALISHLMDSPVLDSFSEEGIKDLFSTYPEELNAELNVLLEKLKAVSDERLQRLTELKSKIGDGNLENGRDLYFGKSICASCHTLGAKGVDFGPDLTSIEKSRSVHDVLEAILYPSVSFVREYETYEITTKNGKNVGIIKEQSPEVIVLSVAPQTLVRIPKEDIISISVLDHSLMPQGLDQLLTEQEFIDLMAFLMNSMHNQ